MHYCLVIDYENDHTDGYIQDDVFIPLNMLLGHLMQITDIA